MQPLRNFLEVVLFPLQLSLAAICWGYMIYYVIIRLKQIKTEKLNENKTN
jgi:hypothetical protein